ncbi:hypothetical protein LOAG_14935, partial [Loa loa]
MEKNKRWRSSMKKLKLTSKEKTGEVLSKLSSEELSNPNEINTDLSKEKIEKSSSKKRAGKISEKIEKRTGRKITKASREKHFGSKEPSSFSSENVREDFGSKETVGKFSGSKEFSREISGSKESTKDRKSKSKESLKCTISSRSTEKLKDKPMGYNKK